MHTDDTDVFPEEAFPKGACQWGVTGDLAYSIPPER